MATWTCPDCGRQFGKTKQGHMCAPGVTLADYFSTARPEAEEIFDAIHRHLSSLEGDLIVDPLASKILFKHGPVFATLQSMTRWVALGLTLGEAAATDRTSRKVSEYQGRYHHVFNLTSADQIDPEMCQWLTEAFYLRQGGPPSGDPMVPDDIDDPW